MREKKHVSINTIIIFNHTNIQSISHHRSKKACIYKRNDDWGLRMDKILLIFKWSMEGHQIQSSPIVVGLPSETRHVIKNCKSSRHWPLEAETRKQWLNSWWWWHRVLWTRTLLLITSQAWSIRWGCQLTVGGVRRDISVSSDHLDNCPWDVLGFGELTLSKVEPLHNTIYN